MLPIGLSKVEWLHDLLFIGTQGAKNPIFLHVKISENVYHFIHAQFIE